MKSRESAAVQAEATHDAALHPQREKNDPLVQRYLGAALFKALAGLGRQGDRRADRKTSKRRAT
ncbi:MAG: hypothetical protein ABJC62_10105 [Frankiaceae bacterium]